ncbi:MAG: hypothetical protein HOP16_02570 [Acidobacteria bacterium]|nr:hypothetical protein [Acidobacteriota bacterium]
MASRALAMTLVASAALATHLDAALTVETLRSTGGLPPHIVGVFEEPIGFQQSGDGSYVVFDRRGHTVYRVDAARTSTSKIVEIGQEVGRIIQPRGFDVSATGSFVVADAPKGVQRVQVFEPPGNRVAGFLVPAARGTGPVTFGEFVMSGISSIQFAGSNLLISHPENGALFTEYAMSGAGLRNIGRLRDTGHEHDRDLHIALNAGLPLADPTGGYFYIFVAGVPMFRKYDARGTLLYERHIEGAELDAYLASLPTHWPTRRVQDREMPLVVPAIRAATVDTRGRLWISLNQPFTYVYDRQGDKIRTVQFRAAGLLSPTSLSFTSNGRLLVTPGCYEFNPGLG